jgi:hypothetical protein
MLDVIRIGLIDHQHGSDVRVGHFDCASAVGTNADCEIYVPR